MKGLFKKLTWPKIFILLALGFYAAGAGFSSTNLAAVGAAFLIGAILWWLFLDD